jgi:hypothetical protein
MTNPRMSAEELRAEGYLFEANRRFFHPLGLALAVTTDDETGEVTLGPIIDVRDDPEGMYFGDLTDEDRAKAANVERIWKERAPARKAALGWIVEPIDP